MPNRAFNKARQANGVIDLSLLSHIINGHFLKGTFTLEGNTFQRTLSYLNRYIESLQPEERPTNILALQGRMTGLIEQEQRIEAIRGMRDAEGQDALNRLCLELADNLLTTKQLSLPGGWVAPSGGHAMLYLFDLTEKDLYFHIYNSGAGLHYHARHSGLKRELYSPVLTYRTPLPIEKPQLIAFLNRLLLPNLPHLMDKNTPDYDDERLYKEVFPSIHFLSKKVQLMPAGDRAEHLLTAGQLSGNCSQQVLHQLLKESFDNPTQYQQFIYKFKRHALDDYMHVIRHGQALNHKGVRNMLQHALRTLERILITPDLFEEAYILKEHQALKPYWTQLMNRPESEPAAARQGATIMPETRYRYLNSFQQPVISDAATERLTSQHRLLPQITCLRGGAGLLSEMETLLLQCEALKANEQRLDLLEGLERVFIHLPLPNKANRWDAPMDFYQDINAQNQTEFYLMLNQLKNIYTEANTTKQSPRTLVVGLSVLFTVDYLQHRLSPWGSLHAEISFVVNTYFKGQHNNPYLATNHPDFDRRLQAIKAFYLTQKPLFPSDIQTNFIQYYSNIINSEPGMKEQLLALHHALPDTPEQRALNALLKKNRCTALYYFSRQQTTIVPEQADYAALNQKFINQNLLEKNLCDMLSHFINTAEYGDIDCDLFNREGIKYITLQGRLSVLYRKCLFDRLKLDAKLETHQYTPLNKAPHQALCRDFNTLNVTPRLPVSDNAIQLFSPSVLDRTFFHLRNAPSLQIKETLDYFKNHLNQLSDPSAQIYMRANVFQPGLLLDLLDEREQGRLILDQVERFIEAGMQHYTVQGCCTQTSLFFIEMAYRVYDYAAKNGSNHAVVKLETLQQRLICWLKINQDNTAAIQHSLHQYQFLIAVARLRINPKADIETRQALLAYAIPSLICMNASSNPQITHDKATQLEHDCAEQAFSHLLQETELTHQMTRILRHAIARLDLGVVTHSNQRRDALMHDVWVQKEGSSTHYTINLSNGRVFNENGWAISATPSYILEHPAIVTLGMHVPKHCVMNQDASVIETGASLRFQTRIPFRWITGYNVQKTWEINGRIEWYQLSAFNWEQARAPGAVLANPLPEEYLKQRDTHVWMHCTQRNIYIITECQQPIFRFVITDASIVKGELKQLDTKNGRAFDNGYALCVGENRFSDLLSAFESPRFMRIYQKNADFQVHFFRYGLTVLAQNEGADWFSSGRWVFRLQEKPAFKLVTDKDAQSCAKLPHLPDVAALIFEEDATQKRCCYIAVQPFIAQNRQSAHSEFYHFTHDVNAVIPEEIIKNADKPLNGWTPWTHRDSERFILYSLNQNNEPQAEKGSDALYLCYLYLGNHCPEKAWAVLDDIRTRLGGLRGTAEELYPLEMIIQALPRLVDIESKKATISTPAYVACQMKALALWARVFTRDKKITFPKAAFDNHTPDGFYKNQCIKKTVDFYTQLNTTLYELYSRFQKMQLDETHDFHITDDERLDLLTYYHAHLPGESPKALGTLGVEWQTLSIRMLKREWAALEAEKTMHGALPPAYQKRQQEILQVVNEADAIHGHHCELTLRPIDLSIPQGYKADEQGPWANDDLVKAAETQEMANAMLALNNSNISASEFLQWFPSYYQLVTTSSSSTSADRIILLNFCHQYLLANRYTPLDQQPEKATYFCNILYRIACNLYAYNRKIPLIPLTNENIRSIACGLAFQWTWPALPISLKKVLTWAKELPDPVITVYEQQDTASLILAEHSTIWAACTQEMHTPSQPMKAMASRDRRYFGFSFLLNACSLNQQKKDTVKNLAEAYQQQAKILGAPPQVSADEEITDFSAGVAQGNALSCMKQISYELLGDFSTRTALQEQAVTFIEQLDTSITRRWDAILKRANSGFESTSHDTLHKAIKQDCALLAPLTREKILALYCMADKAGYALATGLSEQDIDRLHTELTHLVSLTVRQQSLQRFVDQVHLLPQKAEPSALQLVTHALLTEDLVDYETEPVLAVFQYYEKILLRPQQKGAIRRLVATPDGFSFVESIEKIIMGGGKSKVILPLVAQFKARGTNLVVIEVPRALLETNIADLSQTSMTLFNQTVHRFDFNREQDCDLAILSEMYSRLMRVITQKNYLVTTGDALQSLELKYIEQLLNTPENEAEKSLWAAQVEGLDRLVHLFRTRADAVIDEVHQALLFKKKLNYTVGDAGQLPSVLIQESVRLYHFLDGLSFSETMGPAWRGKSLLSLLDNNQLLAEEDDWPPVMMHLAKALLTHPDSPLQHAMADVFSTLSDEAKDELSLYLLNQGDNVPACVLASSHKRRTIFALYKEQLSHLLPITLRRKLNEKYGKSELNPDSGLAIPYAANNEPSERSRFGNVLESMNFSIQMGLKEGVPQARLRSHLCTLLERARLELFQQPQLLNVDHTPTGKLFHEWAPGFQLNHVSLDDEEQFTAVFNALKYNKALICSVLEGEILPNLAVDDEILHSDACNHVDIYRSCQGCTGTPWNSSTYHPRLVFNPHEVAATDGFMMDLLEKKGTSIRTVAYDAPVDEWLPRLLAGEKRPNAIIDICAAFKGLSNQNVAEQLADYLRKTTRPPQYILYFNQDNQLSALSVAKGRKPIVLHSSDPQQMDALLHCKPEDRFSYYDQAHTVGADLKQAPHAHALALVDHETQAQDFLQGIMRMRGFADEQSIEIIVPPILSNLSRKALLDKMLQNEKRQLQQDNFYAVKAKMNNVIRNDIIQRLLACSSVKEKQRTLLAFKSIFVSKTDADFFERYGYLSSQKDTRGLLENLGNQLMLDWSHGLIKLEKVPGIDEESALRQTLHDLIERALPLCLDQYSAASGQEEGTEVEIQHQVELQQEQEQEQEQEQQQIDRTLKPYSHRTWLFSPGYQMYTAWNGFLSLDALCQQSNDTSLEWGEIYIGRNYYQVYEGQAQFIGNHLKPVHALLFRKSSDGKLDCVILSQQEAEELAQAMNRNPEPNIWLTTTQHTALAGQAPLGIQQDPGYQALIEKVSFFNGELLPLIQRDTPLNWLWKDTDKKLAFFEQTLRLPRQTNQQELNALRQSMSDLHAAFDYFRTHPAQDYTAEQWWDAASTTLSENEPQQVQFARDLKTHGTLKNITEIMVDQAPEILCVFLEANHFKTDASLVKAVLEAVDKNTADSVMDNLSSMNDVDPEVTQALIAHVRNEQRRANHHFLFNCLVGIAVVAAAAVVALTTIIAIAILALLGPEILFSITYAALIPALLSWMSGDHIVGVFTKDKTKDSFLIHCTTGIALISATALIATLTLSVTAILAVISILTPFLIPAVIIAGGVGLLARNRFFAANPSSSVPTNGNPPDEDAAASMIPDPS